MEPPELTARLRVLQSLIQGAGFDEEAFDLWNEIKSQLRPKHRYELIVAWSRSVSPGTGERFEYVCEKVIADLEDEDQG